MDVSGRSCSPATQSEEEMDLRRGPWTDEEDFALVNYIAHHGEGRWNSLARCAGLKRTGKSCRLRWLNYLRPDVRRGNITLEEQLLILELHSRWGNRWSKIAQHLPGRTDNEIKNYWRTRVQKHAKQLKCDVNSKQFKDTMRYLWMPRLVEKIRAAAATPSNGSSTTASSATANNAGATAATTTTHVNKNPYMNPKQAAPTSENNVIQCAQVNPGFTSEYSSTAGSSDSFGTQVSASPVVSDPTDYYNYQPNIFGDLFQGGHESFQESLTSPSGYINYGLDFEAMEQNSMWLGGGDESENLWNVDDVWFLQQQFFNGV